MDTDQPQGTPEELQPTPGAESQPEATPTSNQQPTEDAPQPPSEEQLALEGSKNPERTKAYIDRLKEENRQLKAQAGNANYGASVFDSFRAPEQANVPDANQFGFLNQGQVDQIATQFIDAEGNVDVHGLNRALTDANSRAERAEREARSARERIERFEETQQVREAHTAHPELDPRSDNFDPRFYDLVRDRVLRNMYEGRSQTLADVASEIRTVYTPVSTVNVAKVQEEAVAAYKQQQAARSDQGPVASGRGETRNPTANYQELRERTRKGDDQALAARLDAYERSQKEGGTD